MRYLIAVFVLAGCALAFAAIPPGEPGAKDTLAKSPRHGEWAEITVPGRSAPLKAWVVYPETKDKAGVVIVIHEIFGLTDWIRGVSDQLAADGFIAIAPDLLSGHGPDSGGTESLGGRDEVVKAIRALKDADVQASLDAVRDFGMKLPASNGKTAAIGFCWGGSTSFKYAAHQPQLNAAVVYYGSSPDAAVLANVKAPVLGLYGSDDARVNATIEPADAEMKKLGKTFNHHMFDGAGHGFLRQQDGRSGANQRASEAAWPKTIEFLRKNAG